MMSINPNVENAINDQIHEELYSEYLYLAMAAHFDHEGMRGFSNWLKKQAAEERTHAVRLWDHLVERGSKVRLKALDSPPDSWQSPLALFEAVLAHEKHITGRIGEVMKVARFEKDTLAMKMLEWFVKEQVEEEASADKIRKDVAAAKGSIDALKGIDRELARR
jgi:ferritin